MLRDLANDDGFVALKRAERDGDRERMRKTFCIAVSVLGGKTPASVGKLR